MRRLVLGMAVLLLRVAYASAAGTCLDADLAQARAAIDVACPCDAAASRGAYRHCVRAALATRVLDRLTPAACLPSLRRCAARSTCGRPGTVACCQVSARGTRCRIRPSADRCVASGGAVRTCPSCCEACTAGCASGSTTSSTTTTTTLPDPLCAVSGFPTCGGSCGGGLVCAPVRDLAEDFRFCRCVDPGTPCITGACTAPGVCPPGEACTGALIGGQVFCGGCESAVTTTSTTAVPTTTTTLPFDGTCGTAVFPTCGGSCNPGFVCQASGIRGSTGMLFSTCTCVADTSTCVGTGTCVPGRCPNAGEACVLDVAANPSGCACVLP